MNKESYFPERPDVPEFWKLSKVLLRNDGDLDMAEDPEQVFQDIVAKVIPIEVVIYVGIQRALRLSPDISEKMVAFWIDGFIAGAGYVREGG